MHLGSARSCMPARLDRTPGNRSVQKTRSPFCVIVLELVPIASEASISYWASLPLSTGALFKSWGGGVHPRMPPGVPGRGGGILGCGRPRMPPPRPRTHASWDASTHPTTNCILGCLTASQVAGVLGCAPAFQEGGSVFETYCYD